MSHGAQQIRDWFVTSLTGVSGLATPREGVPRQIEAATPCCIVTSTLETVERQTAHAPPLDRRTLTVQVIVTAATLDAADNLSMKAEEAVAAATSFPGKNFELTQREYDENVDTDRDYVAVTISYLAEYYVLRTDVETMK